MNNQEETTARLDQYDYEPETEIVIMSEGSAVYTADELAARFIVDAYLLIVDGNDAPTPSEFEAYQIAETFLGAVTIEDEDLSQMLNDECLLFEGSLGEFGYLVDWEDGYIIRKVIEA